MSMVRPESRLNHYRLLAGSLAVLAVILLALDIGLGVYCKSIFTHKTPLICFVSICSRRNIFSGKSCLPSTEQQPDSVRDDSW